MWMRSINEVKSKKRRPLTIFGCGTSYDLYDDIDARVKDTDIFAINAAVTETWKYADDDRSFWWFAHDINRIFTSPFRDLFESRLRGWDPWRLVTWDGWFAKNAEWKSSERVTDEWKNGKVPLPENSFVWTYGPEYCKFPIRNTFQRAMETALRWGYTDIRLLGIDMKVKKSVRLPGMLYREYTQYYADAFLWKPRPGDNMKKWRTDAANEADRWKKQAKITLCKHSLWSDMVSCPFEIGR